MGFKAGINGFGRIGRNVLRVVMTDRDRYKDLEIVSINDLTDSATLAHLFKYDSVFGVFPGDVTHTENSIIVNGNEIKIYSEKEPSMLPWKSDGVEIVVESTGRFTEKSKAMGHIEAGAKKVIISAPGKGEDLTVVLGVNEDKYNPGEHHIVSNASCTTNCLAPVVKILHESFGIEKGLMTTIHSYTNDQRILDLPHRDLRRARAAALSMIPTTTGAARAVTLVIPELKGKLDGMAIRVPTPDVSVVDFVCNVNASTSKDDVIAALKEASEGKMKGILDVCGEPLVSIDYTGNPHSSIVDALSVSVIEGTMIKVLSWYDNEWGYSNRVADLALYIMK